MQERKHARILVTVCTNKFYQSVETGSDWYLQTH